MKCPKCNKNLTAVTDTFYSCNFCAWMGMVTEEANKLRVEAQNLDAKTRAQIALLTLENISDFVVKKAEGYNKKWEAATTVEDKRVYEGAATAMVQTFDYLKALAKDLEGYLK